VILDLTTNEHPPLLGALRAVLGFSEVGLETFVFASHDIDTLLCLGLHSRNASVSLHLNAFDALIGFSFDTVDSACRLSQLVL
jgi:hypothetical protein